MKRKNSSGGGEVSSDDEDKVALYFSGKLPHKGEAHDAHQKKAFKAIVNGHNVFLTGAGGCGKTFLLRDIFHHFINHKYRTAAMTSMTGVTAMMINGKTFASFFGFGVEEGDQQHMWKLVQKKSYLRKRFQSLSALIIDEISMLSAEMLEAASFVASQFRKTPSKPFGGLQVVLCGDFSQLPPIRGAYAFLSPTWDELNLEICELRGNHRQSEDVGFYMMLNSVRVGNVDTYVRNTLKERVNAVLEMPEGVEPAFLTSRRDEAQKINEERLDKLDPTTEHFYAAQLVWQNRGSLNEAAAKIVEKQTLKNMVTPAEMKLRKGALVMLTFNLDLGRNLGNGSMGIIKRFRRKEDDLSGVEFPEVEFHGTETVLITPHTWIKQDLQDKSTLHYKQVPLLLAYAVTTHKAQGATLDYVSLRLDRSCFADGMAYVALSRARALNKITLQAFHPESIQTSHFVSEFYRKHGLALIEQ